MSRAPSVAAGTAPGLGPPTEPASRGLAAVLFFSHGKWGGYDDLMVEFYRMGFSWNFHGDLVDF